MNKISYTIPINPLISTIAFYKKTTILALCTIAASIACFHTKGLIPLGISNLYVLASLIVDKATSKKNNIELPKVEKSNTEISLEEELLRDCQFKQKED